MPGRKVVHGNKGKTANNAPTPKPKQAERKR
jgi:hypothetical protein